MTRRPYVQRTLLNSGRLDPSVRFVVRRGVTNGGLPALTVYDNGWPVAGASVHFIEAIGNRANLPFYIDLMAKYLEGLPCQ